MLFDLTGKVALVTGGSRGLGLEIAEGFLEAGATVIITARREQWLDAALRQLRQTSDRCAAEVCDVTDPAGVDRLVETIVARFGPIDVVANNAGISWGAPALEMDAAQFRRVLDTNATGTFLVARAAARTMLGRGGAIVNTSSVAGQRGGDPEVIRAAGYHASKGAIDALTRELAVEWAPEGIRVNAIAPGFFPTRLSEGVIAHAEERIRARVPLGRLGQPGEIKGAAVFLASAASSYITGQILAVDGGTTAW